jgi:hypothetical protein
VEQAGFGEPDTGSLAGDANQVQDQELIDWIRTCKRQGDVCALDWPFDPKTDC